MSDLTHLFKIGQIVKIQDENNAAVFANGVVKETHKDYIIVTNTDDNTDGRYAERQGIGRIYPDYNFHK